MEVDVEQEEEQEGADALIKNELMMIRYCWLAVILI